MKNIISKLLMGTITEKELIGLRNWLNDPQNRSLLESYIRDYHDLNLAVLKNDVDVAYTKVMEQIEKRERPVKRMFPNWARYAAAIAVLLGMGYFYQQGFFSPQNNTLIVPKEDSVTLELDNGALQTIDLSQTKKVKDADGNIVGDQKQDQISYSGGTATGRLLFNTLTIPNGKQFQLRLSDGTDVHLNAGSSLRYPVNFSTTGSRQVFLTGQAYFKVSKDRSRPFIVKAEELDIEVLGTEFNVSAYMEDENIDVVLVEGAVSLEGDGTGNGPTKLSPGQKGSFGHASKIINVNQVNTALYTSWRQGHLVFRNVTFDNILKKLERHYNIEIENGNRALGNEIFNASFNKVGIEEILSFFNDAHEIEYTVENNRVIIK